MEFNNLGLKEMANILVNETALLYCTLEEAWKRINPDITNQFDFEKVKTYINENISQCNF